MRAFNHAGLASRAAGSRASKSELRLRRRVFLSALGVGLGASAAARLSSSALAQPSGAPKRFLLFFMPHGAPPEHFKPLVMPSDPTSFALDQSGVSILGPLQQDFHDYVTVVQGIKYPEGAMTHEAVVACLSGVSGGGGTLPDDSVQRVTLEHQIASGLGVRPLILGACAHRPFGLDKDGKLMWDGTAVVPEKNPLLAYDAVFGGLGAGQPTAADPDVELNRALHALTESELSELKIELSKLTAEQTKLQVHLEAIQALKGTGSGGTAISCTEKPNLPAVEALRSAAAGQSDEFFLKEDSFPALLAAQLQLAGAALRCNARQVVAVQPMYTNCDFDFDFMGASGAHHGVLSHTQPQQRDSVLDITVRQGFATCQRWFFEQLVTHTLTPLLEPDPADPGRRVIDNTIVYVMSEIGEGAYHPTRTQELQPGPGPAVASYVPSVIIGGGGGALKTGQVVTFAADRPAGDLYLSLCEAMGVTGAFPDASARVAEVLA
jgi:hypothetical protein